MTSVRLSNQAKLQLVEQEKEIKKKTRESTKTRTQNLKRSALGYHSSPLPSHPLLRYQLSFSLTYNNITPKARPTTDPAAPSFTPALVVCSAAPALLVPVQFELPPELPVCLESETEVERVLVAAEIAELRAEAEAVLVLYIDPVCVTETAASVCWSRGSTLAKEV